MEKAMHQAHGMGYEEYARSLDNVIRVEKTREKHYYESKQVVADAMTLHA